MACLGTNFVQAMDIKVVDPLPAKAVFVSATNGGVYDAATHTVTWSYDKLGDGKTPSSPSLP